MTCGFGSIEPHLPLGGGQTHSQFARAHRLPTPPRGNAEYDQPSLMLHAMLCVSQWVGPPAAPTVVGVGAGASPDCAPLIVWVFFLLRSMKSALLINQNEPLHYDAGFRAGLIGQV